MAQTQTTVASSPLVLDAQTALNVAQSNLVNQTVTYRRNITNLSRSTGDLLAERQVVGG